MPLKIAIGVHGRFHAFDLARALDAAPDSDASVHQLATTYPRIVARRFLPARIPLRTAPALEIWRRFYSRTRLGPHPDTAINRAFGHFAARTLPDDADVFVGWSGASLEAISVARSRGIRTVLERGSTHILHQQAVLERVYEAQAARFLGIPAEIIERELAEYETADLIAVPTQFAADTFRRRGIGDDRLLVNPYGVDGQRYDGGERVSRTPPTVLFVGAVGFQKGAPDLLAGFRKLDVAATLRFAGPVESGWNPDLPANVHLLGPLDSTGVVREYRNADIFCLPSHQEGMPLSLLQAMAAGLPVIATRECGAGELFTHGIEGLIVESGNREALTAALAELASDSNRRGEMGRNAARKSREMTWEAYGNRALTGYKDSVKQAAR